jgi:hypothetical protein
VLNRYVFLVLVGLSSCAKKASLIPQAIIKEQPRELLSQEDYARLCDIPFTPDAVPYNLGISSQDGTRALEYETKLSTEAILTLCKTHMDYWGWHQAGMINKHKSCLLYQKPSKYCIITLCPITMATTIVTLYIGRAYKP